MGKKTINNPKERRDVFAGELREKNIDLALISNPKHIFYFSGFPSNLNLYYTLMKGPRSTSFLTIDSVGRASLLIGKGELSNQWTKKPSDKGPSPLEKLFDGEVTTYADYDLNERMITYGDVLSSEFQKWIKKGGVRRMGIEEWHLPDVYRSAILSGGGRPEIAGISRAILSLRKMKGSDEIENLKAATGILDFAYKAAQKNARQGKTELDVYRKMNYRTFEKYGPFAWIIGDD